MKVDIFTMENDGKKVIPYDTVSHFGEDEVTEKKSKFIAHVMPVASEEEALKFIEEKKKQYWDARHNCYAYIIGGDTESMRFSDDGEPSGTAGKPILDVLQKRNLKNVAVVVTRYFGGVLLGTGGLVRAYTESTQKGIEAAEVCRMIPMVKIKSVLDYSYIGKIKYILAQNEAELLSEEYETDVTLVFGLPFEQKNSIIKKLTEATNGHTIFEESEGELLWKKMKN